MPRPADEAQAAPVAVRLAVAVLTFIAVPLLITAMYRALPIWFPGFFLAPFVAVAGALAALWFLRPRWRVVSVAGSVSLLVFGLFLLWLLTTYETLD